jgi:hypothetical protein
VIPLASKTLQGDGYVIAGLVIENLSGYAAGDPIQTPSFRLVFEANVTAAVTGKVKLVDPVFGNIQLFDPPNFPASEVDITNLGPQRYQYTFTPFSTSEATYELHVGLDTGGGPYTTEQIVLWGARIEVIYTVP